MEQSQTLDFISDDNTNGAVGVYKDGLRWISRDDGSFSSDAEANSSLDGSIIEYSSSAITVSRNVSAKRTEIEIWDGINVTIMHIFGGIYTVA